MRVDIIQRAKEVQQTLATFTKYEKSENELRALQDGRASLTLQLLDIEPSRIDYALEVASKERDSLYAKLTYLVNSEDK